VREINRVINEKELKFLNIRKQKKPNIGRWYLSQSEIPGKENLIYIETLVTIARKHYF
jgi:hypothetical protein